MVVRVVELQGEIAVRLSVEMVMDIRSMKIMAVVEILVVARKLRRDTVTERVGGGEPSRVDEIGDGIKHGTNTGWRGWNVRMYLLVEP